MLLLQIISTNYQFCIIFYLVNYYNSEILLFSIPVRIIKFTNEL